MAAMDEEKEETTTTTTKMKEGANLLGAPTFTDLQNGRFRCVETGHEVLEKDKESYSQSKRCRLGLIDYALTHKKPPLNMFKQNPTSRSKLICELTGDTVNKSEEHIWKHINGRRFLNKLEEKELEKASNGLVLEEGEEKSGEEHNRKEKKKKKKEKNKKKEEKTDDVADEVDGRNDDEDDSQEPDFWMPPVGDRWDFDDGGDRWGSGSDSEEENEEQNPTGEDDDEDGDRASDEISTRRKRKTKEINSNGLSLEKKDKNRKNKKKISRTRSEA